MPRTPAARTPLSRTPLSRTPLSRTLWATALLVAILQSAGVTQDARAIITTASDEMGVTGLETLTYTGAAASGNFGQSRTISFGLSSTPIRGYARTIDFRVPVSRATGETDAGEYDEIITPEFTAWEHQMKIWVTPWGFLRGAAAASPTLRTRTIEGVPYKVVTWSPAQKAPSGAAYLLTGYINDDNLVERVETWVEHPILGDLHVEYFYTGYRMLRSVMMPARMAERRAGMETFVVAIQDADSNIPEVEELLALPPADERRRLAAPPPSPPAASSERLADGVYRIDGGYRALAVEFKDHVVVLEAPQSEARGLAILAEARRLFPAKRVRFVVNTHAHFDHAAGLPPFVSENVTVITDDTGRYFVEQSLSQPRTLLADTLARTKRKPKVDGVLDKRVLTDGARTIELYHLAKFAHSDGMLVAWLPAEKILFSADAASRAAALEQFGFKAERFVEVQ